MNKTLTSLLVMAAASPALLADISTGAPASQTPQTPTRIQGNCDLLASNTVRATFLGVRTLQVQTFEQETPGTVDVAVFEVIDNLAYRRLVRYGDGSLKPGARFTVSMSRDLPGQPASVVDTISQMQPGEEAVMKIDHLYLFGDQEGKPIRPCSRMARRQGATADAPAPQPQLQTAPSLQTSAVSRQVSVSMNGNGQTETREIITQKLPGSNEVTRRMFINGVEVDPATKQPLADAQQANPAAPAPVTAPATPAQQKPDEHGDDTTVEQAPQNAVPVAPAAPAAGQNESF